MTPRHTKNAGNVKSTIRRQEHVDIVNWQEFKRFESGSDLTVTNLVM